MVQVFCLAVVVDELDLLFEVALGELDFGVGDSDHHALGFVDEVVPVLHPAVGVVGGFFLAADLLWEEEFVDDFSALVDCFFAEHADELENFVVGVDSVLLGGGLKLLAVSFPEDVVFVVELLFDLVFFSLSGELFFFAFGLWGGGVPFFFGFFFVLELFSAGFFF